MTEPTVLIVFHSVHGQTARVAQHLATTMRVAGVSVDVRSIEAAPAPDPYDVVVIGDALHAVHYGRELRTYVRRHAQTLNAKPSGLFQLSLTSIRTDDGHTRAARAAMDVFLDITGFEPSRIALFAGALPYSRYNWFIRWIMTKIVRREGGDTDTTQDYEYTDWNAVDSFAHELLDLANLSHRGATGHVELDG